MSIGLQLMYSVLVQRSTSAMRALRPEYFTPEERPAFNFVQQFSRAHGVLPTPEVCTENGVRLILANQPVTYYLERVRKRTIGADWNEMHPQFVEAMANADVLSGQTILEQMVRSGRQFAEVNDVMSLSDAAQLVADDYQEAAGTYGLRGVTWGWDYADRVTGGATPGDVFAWVARPKVGKSWTMLYNAMSAWRAGKSVFFLSMEMSVLQAARRMLAMQMGWNPRYLREGRMSHWGEERMYETIVNIENGAPFHFAAGDMKKSVADYDNFCMEFSPDIGYVDAAYLLDPDNRSGQFSRYAKHEALQETLRGIKQVSFRRDIPSSISVQFNREFKAGKNAAPGSEVDFIGGSDWIGQICSGVFSIAPGENPYQRTRRRYKVVAGRDMEMGGEWETEFLFTPFSMDFIREIKDEQQDHANQTQAQMANNQGVL